MTRNVYWISTEADIRDLKGLVLTGVRQEEGEDGDRIVFETPDSKFGMSHWQDCCENVDIEDIIGDLNDLVGNPILEAEEVSSGDDPPRGNPDSYTWTFYKIGTIHGSVTIRWYGESNGWYSERVSFYKYK